MPAAANHRGHRTGYSALLPLKITRKHQLPMCVIRLCDCAHSHTNPLQGDSGSGVYYWDIHSQRYYLLGVTSGAAESTSEEGVVVSIHEDLTARYEELCYYLGLCLPGYDLYQLREKGVKRWVRSGRLVLNMEKH